MNVLTSDSNIIAYMWLIVSTVLLKLKDFSKSQAVTYMVKVVISQKWYNIETLSLQITNRK